jgi:hypothetical protein
MVPLTDFLTGVLSALIIYAVLKPFLDPPRDTRGRPVPQFAREMEAEFAPPRRSALHKAGSVSE